MKVTLQPLNINHLDEIFKIKNDPEILEYIPGEYPLDRNTFNNRHLKSIAAGQTEQQAEFTIHMNDKIVGLIGHFTQEDDENIQVGYIIGKKWWGRGIATKAVLLHLQEMRNLSISGQVYASHAIENTASGRVLEKAGFVAHGKTKFTLPDGIQVLDNQWLILL